jgi:3',5'-cyclic AMP phosphodiesterase CpdA
MSIIEAMKTNALDRRHFLSLSAAAAAAAAIPAASQSPLPAPAEKPGTLRFIFFTDTHTEPELSAAEGTAMAMRKIKSLRPEFCIQGGDHCFDINAAPRERATMLLDLYRKTEHALDGIPVHHTLGNHDIFGAAPSAGVSANDPLYGKKAFEQTFNSKTYYSFDSRGYHFVILDSIGITPDGEFEGRVDRDQLVWLAADLLAVPAGTPVVVVSHIPLVSAIGQYRPDYRITGKKHNYFLVDNSFDVLPIFEGHNVIAVLQGHTHVNETVYWRNTPYITSGAVSGNWWKGPRWGTPEGFTVVELAAGRAHWRYDTYGWKTVAPEEDTLPPIANPRHS